MKISEILLMLRLTTIQTANDQIRSDTDKNRCIFFHQTAEKTIAIMELVGMAYMKNSHELNDGATS